MKKIFLIMLIFAAASAGMVWYGIHSQIIIITLPAYAEYGIQQTDKKTISFYRYHNEQKIEEKTTLLWSQDLQDNIAAVTSAWLATAQEEDLVQKNNKVDIVAVTSQEHEAFISFSHTLFDSQMPLLQKWLLIESLILTLRKIFPDLQTLHLLVQGNIFADEHIDCSQSIPLVSFMQTYTASKTHKKNNGEKLTVVIHPHGDKQTTGRIIRCEFERNYMRQLAQELKNILEKNKQVTVLITHEIGQSATQEDNAMLANRLPADLYIDLQAYESKKMLPELSCYFQLYNPLTDFWQKRDTGLALTPLHAAYLKNITQSCAFGLSIVENLKKNGANHFFINPLRGIPLTSLVGISVPSITIECGFQNIDQIKQVAQRLADGLLDAFF